MRPSVHGRWRRCTVAAVACLLGACSPHASTIAPALWGRETVFQSPLVLELGAPARDVRDAVAAVLDEMKLDIGWVQVTAVDGEYVFRSARERKMKITYQALFPSTTRLEIYSTTDERTLQDLLRAAIERRLGVAGRQVGG
jgi:hypothetical protein